jgi:hypothetical protein
MNTKRIRRCSECRRFFVPDPRVGDRQVTCGSAECQRARHSERCRVWHRANAEVARSHYEDVVVPFREQQPDYQRRWRLWRWFGEIREKMSSTGGVVPASLRAFLGRAAKLAQSPTREAQTGVFAGDVLDKAKEAVRGTLAALEQLEASVATLRALG